LIFGRFDLQLLRAAVARSFMASTNPEIEIGPIRIGGRQPLALISGPCVIESAEGALAIAAALKELTARLAIPFIFKASYDKANRTSISAYRGPGPKEGLAVLARIKRELQVPVLSDVHAVNEVAAAAEVLDVIQVPAFLCRQTDLLLAVAATGKPVNVKKGQFLAPWDVANVVEKIVSSGNRRVLVTERGVVFGYNNLVVDFRAIPILQQTGCPVVFDATHSVQLPGGAGQSSGGQRQFAPVLARAAVAAGADAVFMEVHPDPERALCDGPNSLRLEMLPPLLAQLKTIHELVR
jgi:2-dehydro-3-deoxyphosphooctonate aldolase (KDO 8-P synthase)